jgi:hypothetical protein
LICDRNSRDQAPPQRACWANKAVHLVAVIYCELPSGKLEQDILNLCDPCKDFVKRDAESHGYEVKVQSL